MEAPVALFAPTCSLTEALDRAGAPPRSVDAIVAVARVSERSTAVRAKTANARSKYAMLKAAPETKYGMRQY